MGWRKMKGRAKSTPTSKPWSPRSTLMAEREAEVSRRRRTMEMGWTRANRLRFPVESDDPGEQGEPIDEESGISTRSVKEGSRGRMHYTRQLSVTTDEPERRMECVGRRIGS